MLLTKMRYAVNGIPIKNSWEKDCKQQNDVSALIAGSYNT